MTTATATVHEFKKRTSSFQIMDTMTPELRECVHEFGLSIVLTCMKVTHSPIRIRELVREIWAGARQPSQRSNAYETLDWVLIQANAGISAKTLRRVLADNGLVIAPSSPTRAMIDASMKEVSSHTIRCTKEEKHIRRLRAALRTAMEEGLRK